MLKDFLRKMREYDYSDDAYIIGNKNAKSFIKFTAEVDGRRVNFKIDPDYYKRHRKTIEDFYKQYGAL